MWVIELRGSVVDKIHMRMPLMFRQRVSIKFVFSLRGGSLLVYLSACPLQRPPSLLPVIFRSADATIISTALSQSSLAECKLAARSQGA